MNSTYSLESSIPLFHARRAGRNGRVCAPQLFPLNWQQAKAPLPILQVHNGERGRQRKMRIRKFVFPLSATLPLCHGLPKSPTKATVNLLFIQNHLRKLMDSYKLIECGCGAHSSCLFNLTPLVFHKAQCPCCSFKIVACCKKGTGTTGS